MGYLSSSKLSAFPIEIIEHIIDDLENDTAALTATSETCHSLLPICRKHLFRCIDLSPRGTLPLKNLSQLLRYNPDIGLYVRKLKLQLNERLDKLDRWDPSEPNAYAHNILALSQVKFLQSLQIVRVQGHNGLGSCASWNAFHPSLRKSILDGICSPTLTELNISRFILPFATFRSCPNLSILTIQGMMDYSKSAEGPLDHFKVPSHPTPQLRSFTVLDVSSLRYASTLIQFRCSDGHPTIRLDKLKTLAVDSSYTRKAQAIKDIFMEAGEVETLVYKASPPEGCRGLAGWINVGAFSTLTTLKVVFEVMRSTSEVHLQGLCHELDLFPPNNVLEVLDIELILVIIPSLQSAREEQWGQLDRVLSRGFSCLRRVAVAIDLRNAMGVPEIGQMQQFEISRTHFPCLRENAAVEFDFSRRTRECSSVINDRTESMGAIDFKV